MKKTIVGIFALAFLLTSNSAFAAWNSIPADCPVPLAIGNYTTGDGVRNGPNGCWTKTSVSASDGQVINLNVFYDNTNGVDANNTVIHLTQSPAGTITNSNSTYTFSGNLTSSAGNLNFGTVTANLSNPQSLVFAKAKMYAHGSSTGTSVSGFDAFGSGLNLGTIAKDDWGNVVFSFDVGTNGGGGGGGNCTISNFTGNGSTSVTVQSGNSVNLVWNTNGFTSVNISGPNFSSSNTSGSATVYPTYSGNYILTASGGANCNTQTQTVYVNVTNTQSNCYINNFTGNGSTSTTIQAGNAVNLVWSTVGCTSATLSGPSIYSTSLSGNQTVYPQNSATYTLTAYGNNGGAQTQSVYVSVNPVIIVPPVYYPPVVYNNCAVTTVATNVTQSSAILNGLLSGSTGASYFEYGTTVNLGSRTVSRSGSGSYNEVLSGLAPNTIYFFRLVSQCASGLSYGKIEIFQTLGNAVINTVRVIQGTTVIGTQSPIMLKIENRYQYIGVGDTVDYTVTYKNIGKSKLTNPVLQVIVPKGITLTNSSAGTYQTDTNTLTVPLQDLNPGDEGVVYLQGFVNSIDSTTAQIVTTAILVYTSPNGAQENAIAYVLNNPRGLIDSNLGAAAFFAGIFPTTLLGWLLLLILILIIILLTRRYASKSVVRTVTPTGNHTTTTTNY